MKFSGVMLGSDNPQALGAFYSKVLGKPGFQEGDWFGWKGQTQLMLGGHSEVKGQNDNPARIMLAIEVEDVKQSYQDILALGATTVAEPYQPQPESKLWLATVADPDGNYIQLSTPWN